jgi:cytochrome c biogenesis protein CcmG/thiol:disulfide interchange protein DsbE
VKHLAVPALSAVGAIALVALLIFGVTHRGSGAQLSDAVAQGRRPAAPTVALPRLTGSGQTSLAAFRGRVVVLNMFASWCVPCAQEAPALERLQRHFGRRGVTVVGVTWRDTEPDAVAFMRRHGLSYPALRDVSGDFGQALGVSGVPESFLLDRQGRVIALRRLPVTDDWVRTTVEPLADRRAS